MAETAGKATNCTRFREKMPDAASASLSGGFLAAFDAHLRDCAGCRDEFCRVQMLAQKIDQTLSVSLAVEPSAQLVANIRKNILQDINAQPHGAATWRRWSAWATAAGVCAALAILFFVARTSRKFNGPIHDSAAIRASGSSTSNLTAHPRLNADTEVAVTQPRKPTLGPARHASLRASDAKAAEPEVIVQPGQMQAILRLAAATESGRIDGAKLFADQKKTANPLEIKPLVIAALKIAPLDNETAPASSNGDGSDKDFIAGHSN